MSSKRRGGTPQPYLTNHGAVGTPRPYLTNHGAVGHRGPTLQAALPSEAGRQAIGRMIYPRPFFNPLAQALPNRVLANVISLGRLLMMIAQAMIKEIALPRDRVNSRQVLLPFRDGGLKPRFAWKSDDSVQMIGHQQQQPAMPAQMRMVMSGRRQNSLTNSCAAEVVAASWLAVDGDEKETALGDPWRNFMRETHTLRIVHALRVAERYR